MVVPTKIVGGLGKATKRFLMTDAEKSAARFADLTSRSSDQALPLILPRARMTPEFIDQQADRVARQMLGEHVTSGKPKDTTNLAGRSKKESQRVKGLDYVVKPTGNVAQETTYVPRKGDVKVALPGDQTVSDSVLESIDDFPIDSIQQGGGRYGLGQKHLDDPEFWKSNVDPAKSVQGKVDRVAELYEPDRVIGTHLAMGPMSNNFAMHFADANLRAIDWSKAQPKKISVFDNIIAGGYKDPKTGERVYFSNWPGLADPDAALAAMKEDSNLRKWFNNRMKTPSLTEPLGLPNGLSIEYAITEPRIRDMEINMTGLMTGKLKPGAAVEAAGNPHNTYSHRILGEAEGAQEVLTPFVIDFPDAAQHIASTKRPSDFTGTIQKVFPHQKVDDQYIDEYNQYRERIKKLTGQKDGGSIDADQELKAMIADHLDSQSHDQELRAMVDNHLAGGGVPKAIAKGFKKLFANADEVVPAIKGGTRKFGDDAGGNTITKDVGGNWIPAGNGYENNLENQLNALKKGRHDTKSDTIKQMMAMAQAEGDTGRVSQLQRSLQEAIGREAANKWVDSNLRNYVTKQMATEKDPVRKLAEQGITAFPKLDDGDGGVSLKSNSSEARRRREMTGYPEKGVSESPLARHYETLADEAIHPSRAKTYQELQALPSFQRPRSMADMPWINKLDPDEKVYQLSQDANFERMGFSHIMDVLREDIAAGRIRPEQLNKVSMEDAVRRAHQYDEELKAKMLNARVAEQASANVFKEYPEGYKWVQLDKPGQFSLESDIMGHSVRGYEPPKGHPDYTDISGDSGYDTYGHGGYDAIKSGDAKIYSLRDPKGMSHATVEVGKPKLRTWDDVTKSVGKDKAAALHKEFYDIGGDRMDNTEAAMAMFLKNKGIQPLEYISQVKGKQNAAPKEEYLPFVQDFVKSGQYSEVGDLSNTGLVKIYPESDLAKSLAQKGMDVPSYATQKEMTDLLKQAEVGSYRDSASGTTFKPETPPAEGMAEGGGAFKTIQWAKPQHFDGGGIAVPEEGNGYESNKNYLPDIKNSAIDLYENLNRLKNPKAAQQYAKILAAQALGTVPDLANLAVKYGNPLETLPGAKLLKTALTGTGVLDKPAYRSVLEGPLKPGEIKKREPLGLAKSLQNENGDALFGTEDLIKRQQDAGNMYGETVYARNDDGSFMRDEDGEKIQLYQTGRFGPLMEIAGSVAAGVAAPKLAKSMFGFGKNFKKGFDKGYARATAQAESPYLKELGYDSALDKQSVKQDRYAQELIASGVKPKTAYQKAKTEIAENQPSPYPQKAALDLAQQRAALPVEQGGLGLSAGNTAMQRAKAMGFDKDVYHATTKDFDAFDPLFMGSSTGHRSADIPATFTTTSPKVANIFAHQYVIDKYPINRYGPQGAGLQAIDVKQVIDKANIIPLLLANSKNAEVLSAKKGQELIFGKKGEDFRDAGEDFVNYYNNIGQPDLLKIKGNPMSELEFRADQYLVKNLDLIRSRFAAFDPFRRNAAIAAAMGVAAPNLMADPIGSPVQPRASGGLTQLRAR